MTHASARVAAPTDGSATNSTVAGVTPGTGQGDLKLPGQTGTATEARPKTTHHVAKPLPMLRGLTVAEIRAMLGVAALSSPPDETATSTSSGGSTSIISAALRNQA
jgi:hypothetical protein